MVGWHHWLNGCEFEWTLGVGDGQRGLVCCNSWDRKESDTTEWLNWTELNWSTNPVNIKIFICMFYPTTNVKYFRLTIPMLSLNIKPTEWSLGFLSSIFSLRIHSNKDVQCIIFKNHLKQFFSSCGFIILAAEAIKILMTGKFEYGLDTRWCYGIIVHFLSYFMSKYLMVMFHYIYNFLSNSMAKHSVCVCVCLCLCVLRERKQDYK